MRQSAKLNLFLGVRNPAVELLPRQLEHLRCHFGPRRVNPLFPVSLAGIVLAEILLLDHTLGQGMAHADRVAGLMLATLLALAILEHLMLVLPVRADALWIWATQTRAARTSSGRSTVTIATVAGETSGPALLTEQAHSTPTCRLESFSCATAPLP
jgi:hypothetical protein